MVHLKKNSKNSETYSYIPKLLVENVNQSKFNKSAQSSYANE